RAGWRCSSPRAGATPSATAGGPTGRRATSSCCPSSRAASSTSTSTSATSPASGSPSPSTPGSTPWATATSSARTIPSTGPATKRRRREPLRRPPGPARRRTGPASRSPARGRRRGAAVGGHAAGPPQVVPAPGADRPGPADARDVRPGAGPAQPVGPVPLAGGRDDRLPRRPGRDRSRRRAVRVGGGRRPGRARPGGGRGALPPQPPRRAGPVRVRLAELPRRPWRRHGGRAGAARHRRGVPGVSALSKWALVVHIYSAIVLVGSMFFDDFSLGPALKLIPPAQAATVGDKIGGGLRTAGPVTLVLLGSSGVLRLSYN